MNKKYNIQYRTGDSRTRFVYVSYLYKESNDKRYLIQIEGEVIQYERKEKHEI
jgi:hypothetical protein